MAKRQILGHVAAAAMYLRWLVLGKETRLAAVLQVCAVQSAFFLPFFQLTRQKRMLRLALGLVVLTGAGVALPLLYRFVKETRKPRAEEAQVQKEDRKFDGAIASMVFFFLLLKVIVVATESLRLLRRTKTA